MKKKITHTKTETNKSKSKKKLSNGSTPSSEINTTTSQIPKMTIEKIKE